MYSEWFYWKCWYLRNSTVWKNMTHGKWWANFNLNWKLHNLHPFNMSHTLRGLCNTTLSLHSMTLYLPVALKCNLKMSHWSVQNITVLQFHHTVSHFCPWSLLLAYERSGLLVWAYTSKIKGFIIVTVSRGIVLVVIYQRELIDSLAGTLCCFSLDRAKSRV